MAKYRYRPQHAKYMREWRKKNLAKAREYEREYMRKWRAANKDRRSLKARKALLKPNHVANLQLLAARPKPDHCDVCGGTDRIVFDHCHKRGHFRGWLCDQCNRILGAAKDDTKRLLMLVAYLERTKTDQGAQPSIPGL